MSEAKLHKDSKPVPAALVVMGSMFLCLVCVIVLLSWAFGG